MVIRMIFMIVFGISAAIGILSFLVTSPQNIMQQAVSGIHGIIGMLCVIAFLLVVLLDKMRD